MISDEQKEKNYARVMDLVATFPEPRRSQVLAMLDGPIGMSYFTAPASSREEYHDCFPGGLCHHSLNVIANLWRLAKDLCPDAFPKHQLAFVGLFHDLGKVGDGDVERYLPQPSDWHREKGMLYVVNEDMQWMPTSEGALYILQKHGVIVDRDEWLAIRLNDGQYADENRPYRMREPKLALLLHWADRWDADASS